MREAQPVVPDRDDSVPALQPAGYTLAHELRDFPEWHRGTARYGFWAVRVECPQWLALFDAARRHVAGYALGAATALIGPEAAMACTAAVEEEIDRHYSDQLDALEADGSDPELAAMIADFREDEREHRDAALAAGAERAPGYPLLAGAIRMGCRVAIRLAERI